MIQRIKGKYWQCVFVGLGMCQMVSAQDSSAYTPLSLQNFASFREPGKNWVIGGDATTSLSTPEELLAKSQPNAPASAFTPGTMQAVSGSGVAVNTFSRNEQMHLVTKEEFGDLELDLDFMLAKSSNSGVYLMGRYEIQLLDSWTRDKITSSDCGGIYSRWNAQRGSYEGTPPLMNVTKAPGLWQHLHIKFRAPLFNERGEKIKDARFEEVYLNGVMVQEKAFVTGATASSLFTTETAKGPLVLQGDHGPVAFKNIQYRIPPPLKESSEMPPGYWYWETRNPVYLEPAAKPEVLRSFMFYKNNEVLTHVVSEGYPQSVNFSYDLKQGGLFQVWRGKFLDVTRMWVGRGEPQLAFPLGNPMRFADAPALAVLSAKSAPWPDSVAFENIQLHGYTLNGQRSPSFSYTLNGWNVSDSISLLPEGEGLSRTLSVESAPQNLFCRAAAGADITAVADELYAVDGKSYYIRLDKKYKPELRTTAKGQELVVPVAGASPVTYSIIW